MARPRKARTLKSLPAPVIYIPAGWTMEQVAPVEVAIEDFEIMRLADGHGYRIEEAAGKVGVSRSTAGRMLERARRAIALGLEKRAPIYLDASEDLILDPSKGAGRGLPSNWPTPTRGSLAVACGEAELNSPVERIFGRAPAFVIVSADGARLARLENPGFGAKRHAGRIAAKFLKANGVSRVVAGRFGAEAIKALAGETIQPVVANGYHLGDAIEHFQPSEA